MDDGLPWTNICLDHSELFSSMSGIIKGFQLPVNSSTIQSIVQNLARGRKTAMPKTNNARANSYNFDKLFRGSLNQLNINQVRFIIGQLFPFLRYVKDGRQYGIITPKSMCETVKLSSDDNDQLFDNFLPFINITKLILISELNFDYLKPHLQLLVSLLHKNYQQ